jgi:L-asparaginase II
MTNQPYLPVFELTRGAVVETVHYGAIAVVDATGRLVASYGDPNSVTYLRSSAKPIQALSFIENDGQEYYNLSLRELALICASHSGTDDHVAVLLGIHRKTGISESDLLCGTHPPLYRPTEQALRERGEKPTPNRHNCSGKHSGMLAYARMLGQPTADYINPQHPVQQVILKTFSEISGLPVEKVAVGIDGCSAPNFAIPLYNTALAIARICDPENSLPPLSQKRAVACHKIVQAMTSNPDMVGGPNSFDTHLMTTTEGQILSKGGAEGYQVLGVMPGVVAAGSPGLGIAYKISDGDLKSHTHPVSDPRGQARPAVAIEILRQLGALSPLMLGSLLEYGPSFPLYNWRKLHVGEAHPCFQLELAHQSAIPDSADPSK